MIFPIFMTLFIIILMAIGIFMYIYFVDNTLYEKLKIFLGISKIIDTRKTFDISTYNMFFNMNYHGGRIYMNYDLNEMEDTMAYVLDEPEKFEIYVNNEKIELYKINILYRIINYYYIGDEYLILFENDFDTKPFSKLEKNINGTSKIKNHVFIKTTIVTHRQFERGDYMTVYYQSKDTLCRISPPFLEEKYIRFIN